MTTATVETRRGLPVVRPKGEPFSYTVEDRPDCDGEHVEIVVDGLLPSWGMDHVRNADLRITAVAKRPFGRPGALVSFSQVIDDGETPHFEAMSNFASALRWAVAYARKWNRKHGF